MKSIISMIILYNRLLLLLLVLWILVITMIIPHDASNYYQTHAVFYLLQFLWITDWYVSCTGLHNNVTHTYSHGKLSFSTRYLHTTNHRPYFVNIFTEAILPFEVHLHLTTGVERCGVIPSATDGTDFRIRAG